MRTSEEFSSEELYFEDSSESVEEVLDPDVAKLKEWFIVRDMQSLLASSIKLSPAQWLTLCNHVLFHITRDTVALLPSFLASKTVRLSFSVVIRDSHTYSDFELSPTATLLHKICCLEFIYDNYNFPFELTNDVVPFLLQQLINQETQETIDILYSRLCDYQGQNDNPSSYNALEYLLQSGKVSPTILQTPSLKNGQIEFYEVFLGFRGCWLDWKIDSETSNKYLPLSIAYKQEALDKRKEEMLYHHPVWLNFLIFSLSKHVQDCVKLPGYSNCMSLVLKTLCQVFDNYSKINTFLTTHQRLEESHEQEKKVYNNTLCKFWLFSEASAKILPKELKPAIVHNMHALYEEECRNLVKKS